MPSPLLGVLAQPAVGATLGPDDWIGMVRTARHGNLLPRLSVLVESEPWTGALPSKIREQLAAARPAAAEQVRIIRWEVSRIGEALRGVGTKAILLKGAAYVMAGLPAARGRTATDIDILVPRRDLGAVEQALLAAGWEPIKLNPYDQRYYRKWSHELPPLQHKRRGSMVDVHHTILPLTGRLHPDPVALLDAAVPLGGAGRFWTLAPEDIVLHTAVHLFQDGELAGGVRDLVDVDALLRDFGERIPGFRDRLVPRARQLGLERPLFYALRYARGMLGTPVPDATVRAAEAARPPTPVLRIMDLLVGRALLPITGRPPSVGEDAARMLLYIRSHWLRMPPGLLARHLAQKALRRWQRTDSQ